MPPVKTPLSPTPRALITHPRAHSSAPTSPYSPRSRYAVYFTSGFMFLPAGRDIFATGSAIMPDDDKLFAAMHDDTSKAGRWSGRGQGQSRGRAEYEGGGQHI